jgi:UPF0755 protein
MRKVLIVVALLVTMAFMVGGGFVFVYSDFTSSAQREPDERDRPVIERLLDPKRRFMDRATVEELKKQGARFIGIPKGYNFTKAADRLESEGVLSSALLFRTFAFVERGKVQKRGLKAGEFAFHPGMTPPQVFDVLYGEPIVLVERVTIPEGFHLREIAARLEEKGICKKEAFLKAAYDPKLLKKFGIPSDRAEGYLFPDTYDFRLGEKAEVVVSRMIQKFRLEWLPLWEQRAREMGLDRHKAVTLASIIEKETGQKAERELVSSVFHNRRRLTMPLQTDPTTCYAISEVEGWPDGKKCNITSTNKLIRNPYNTYYVRDFPPGPIASPGRASLRAAVFPAQSKYLFFVSKNDGSHIFSEKYSTHAGLVRTWQQDFFRKRGQAVTAPDAAAPGEIPVAPAAAATVPRRPAAARARTDARATDAPRAAPARARPAPRPRHEIRPPPRRDADDSANEPADF